MRGSIKQRSKGSWLIRLDLGYEPDANGILKRKQTVQSIRGTKKQAELKLGELLHAIRSCEYVDPSTMTVGQWLPRLAREREADDPAGELHALPRHHHESHVEGPARGHPAAEADRVPHRDLLREHPRRQSAAASHGAAAGAAESEEAEASREQSRGRLGPRAPTAEAAAR